MSVSALPSITADEPSIDDHKTAFDGVFDADSEFEADDAHWTYTCSVGCV